MKKTLIAIALLAFSAPAYAQLGRLGGALKKVQDGKKAIDDWNFTETEERQLGEEVSLKIRQRFGVVQNAAVHKYVSLVGMTVAKASERPNLNWTFIVLDTDGVNAFAAPGGLVHVTRGALALMKNEAELAAAIGHEVGHVTKKHTIKAVQKGKVAQTASSAAGDRAAFLEGVSNRIYEMTLENSFDRGDEMDADAVAVQITQKAGYAPNPLGEFLTRLSERNKDAKERNGLFASHPDSKARVDKIKQLSASAKTAALAEGRYKSNITYQPVSIDAIATTTDAAAAAAAKKEQPKSGGLGGLTRTFTGEKESTQVSASGGARGLGKDRAAKGGDNPTIVRTAVSAAELDVFRKGIA
jgi:predicted Zn-dependent protease